MQCLLCQHDNRSGAKFCEECAAPLKTTSQGAPPVRSYAEVASALSEALAQQKALPVCAGR
jgi:predicted amidophosphoribosyltransferase